MESIPHKFKNIKFKIIIEIPSSDAEHSNIVLEVPPSATSFDEPAIIKTEKGSLLEYIANTNLSIRTSTRVKLETEAFYVKNEDDLLTIDSIILRNDPLKVGKQGEETVKNISNEILTEEHLLENVGKAAESIHDVKRVKVETQAFNAKKDDDLLNIDDVILNNDPLRVKTKGVETVKNLSHEILQEEDSLENVGETAESIPDVKKLKPKKRDELPKHCERCNKTFRRPGILQRHLRVHEKKDNQYKCGICNEILSTKLDFETHLTAAHNINIKKYSAKCPICEKFLSSKSVLRNHIKTHYDVKSFNCNQCSTSFYTAQSLRHHMFKHIGGVSCRFCNLMFRPGSDIQNHERIHTGERPYICEICAKRFLHAHELKDHIKRHNNDRDFECSICGKKFIRNSILRKHQATHSDEKPYKCIICNAKFKCSPSLNRHKKAHTIENSV